MTAPARPEPWRRLVRLPRLARRRWRRSLALRAIVTTAALCGVVVVAVGLVLLGQIRDQVLENKIAAAVAQSSSGLRYAESQLGAVDPINGDDVRTTLERTRVQLADRGGVAGRFDVLILTADADSTAIARDASLAAQIPTALRADVDEGAQSYQLMPLDLGAEDPTTTLLVGLPLVGTIGDFELYYLFPLDAEQSDLDRIQGTVFAAGVVLVLLVAAVSGAVAALVVRPVRDAALVAERLAQGRLEERMPVRGEDDLARLATSFNEMAASLQSQIRQLESLSRLQQRFTSDVSHELRTPLTTVRMAADLLHSYREDFPAAVARAAELLQVELDRFEALLSDLLEISRYDAGAAVLDPQTVDLRSLIERVASATAAVAARQGTDIVVHAPPTPVLAEVDARRIERIVRNLVVNAVEHGEGLPVDIGVAAEDEAAAITVRDHGIGLRQGEATQVFSRFWRADPSRRRGLGGTGLGLSISLEDAHLHGGWLQAWGAPGQGAAFRLTLPVVAGGELRRSPLPLVPTDVWPGSEPAAVGGQPEPETGDRTAAPDERTDPADALSEAGRSAGRWSR